MFSKLFSKGLKSFYPEMTQNSLKFMQASSFKSFKWSFNNVKSIFTGSVLIYGTYTFYYQKAFSINSQDESGFDSMDIVAEMASKFQEDRFKEQQIIEYLLKHLNFYQQKNGPESKEVAAIHMFLSSHYLYSPQTAIKGIEYMEQGTEIFLKNGGNDPIELLSYLDETVDVVAKLDVDEAIQFVNRIINLKKKYIADKFQIINAFNYIQLANLYSIKEDSENTQNNVVLARAMIDNSSQKSDMLSKHNTNFEMCKTLANVGQTEYCNTYCENALETVNNVNIHPEEKLYRKIRSMEALADYNLSKSDFNEAIKYTKSQINAFERELPVKDQSYYFIFGDKYKSLAQIYEAQKKQKEALESYEQSVKHFEKVEENREILMYVVLKAQVQIHLDLQNFQQAFQVLQKAVNLGKFALSEDHPGIEQDILLLNKLKSEIEGSSSNM